MQEPGDFYTLKGYAKREASQLTSSMEDYLEMICRMQTEQEVVRVNALASLLHVKPSSASKMVNNLKEAGYVDSGKYGYITITEKGAGMGNYLLHRHEVLQEFLCRLNHTEDELEQVEKIEHFINAGTIRNLEKLLRQWDALREDKDPNQDVLQKE